MVAALLGMVLAHLLAMILVERGYPPIALLIEVPLLALAAWVATGARGAAVTATAVTALFAMLTATGAGSRLAELDGGEILAGAAFFGLALLAAVAGTATAAGGRRGKDDQAVRR